MKYISSVFLMMGIVVLAYGSQKQSNINEIFDEIGILLKESRPLTVDYFEEIVGLINQAKNAAQLDKDLNTIYDYKNILYDMYNSRQAVDENNEAVEGVISISYLDLTPLFGGWKKKQIFDPLQDILPSIKEIERKRLVQKQKMFLQVEKGVLATIAIVGVVAAVMNQKQVMATIQERSILLERISKILRNIASKTVNFLQMTMTRLSRQVKGLSTVPLTQPIATTTMTQTKLKNIAGSAGKIGETAKAAVKGMENLRNVADAIKTAALADVKKVAVSVFKDLEITDGTALNLLNREYTMASIEGNRDLAFKIVDTKSGIFDSSLIVIKKMIESGKVKVLRSGIVRKITPEGERIFEERKGVDILHLKDIPEYLNWLNKQFQEKFRDLKQGDHESAYRLWQEFLAKIPFSIKEHLIMIAQQ